MAADNNSESCKRCHHVLSGPFCSHCGHPKEVRRIDGAYILSEISSVFNFDRGMLYTIRELLLSPGLSVRSFILEDRNRLVKPVVFLIICSLAYSIAQQLLHFDDGYIDVNFNSWQGTAKETIFKWVVNNYGYANIIMALFIAFWVKILFRTYPYNFYEILILLCFIMGITMLIFTIFGIADSLSQLPLLQLGANIGFLYIAWAIGQFFDPNRKRNYVKGIFCYLLGMLTFFILAMITGSLLDLLPG